MVVVTSTIGRKNHKAFKEAQEGFSELNNFVQESVSGVKVTKSFGFQADEIQAFLEKNQSDGLFKKYDFSRLQCFV